MNRCSEFTQMPPSLTCPYKIHWYDPFKSNESLKKWRLAIYLPESSCEDLKPPSWRGRIPSLHSFPMFLGILSPDLRYLRANPTNLASLLCAHSMISAQAPKCFPLSPTPPQLLSCLLPRKSMPPNFHPEMRYMIPDIEGKEKFAPGFYFDYFFWNRA